MWSSGSSGNLSLSGFKLSLVLESFLLKNGFPPPLKRLVTESKIGLKSRPLTA